MILSQSIAIKKFITLNKIAKSSGIVCFGSNYFSQMNINELADDSVIDAPIYNRSIENLSVENANEAFDSCVYPLQPKKIFVNIGDADISKDNFDAKTFINKYEWLLLNIHRNCKNCRIFIVSIISDSSAVSGVNEALAKLSSDTGCTYIDVMAQTYGNTSEIKVFSILKPYIRLYPITFVEAMQNLAI